MNIAAVAQSNSPVVRTRELRGSRTKSISLFVLTGILITGTMAFGAVEPWSLFVMQCGAMLLFLGWMAETLFSEHAAIELNPTFWPMLGMGAIALLQLVARTSAYPQATRTTLVVWAMYFAMSVLAVQLFTVRKLVVRFSVLCSCFAGLFALFALVQHFTSPDKVYWTVTPRFGGYVFGSYVNHNHYAGLMEMLLPFPLVAGFNWNVPRPIRFLALFAALFIAASIVMSGSRGGMVALAIEAVVFAALLLRESDLKHAAAAVIGGLLVTIAVVAWLGDAKLFDRLGTFSDKAGESSITHDTRAIINRDSIRMWRERPWLGWGVGTFETTYPPHRTFYTDKVVEYAHNEYIQVLVEQGLVGFVVMLWFLATFAWCGIRNAVHWRESTRRILPVAALVGCAGLLVHSFTDFNLEIPANGAWFFVLAAAACAHFPNSVTEMHLPSRTKGES